MKTVGLLGGMSWESTATYYRVLNELARSALGGLHSAKLLLHSFDFAEMESLQQNGEWQRAARQLCEAAQGLERAGADCLLIATNTMHRVADEVQSAISIPLLHIADCTAHAIKAQGAFRPALLGTRYTMEQDFYRGRLQLQHGLQVALPDPGEREQVHRTIYEELCRGQINPDSRQAFLKIVANARDKGADSVILGCTEIGLLLSSADFDIPVFDSTRIHAEAAMAFALNDA